MQEIVAWHGNGADMVNLLDGETTRIEVDTLVTATVGEARAWLAEEYADSGMSVHTSGDRAAPRLAVMAIYEGRDPGQRL